MLVDLLGSFSTLPQPSGGRDSYSASVISPSSQVRIAKDTDGNPSVLFTRGSDDRMRSVPLELRNLTYLPSCAVEIVDAAGDAQRVSVSLLKCVSEDWALRRYFLRILSPIVADLGDAPAEALVSECVEKVVELFHALDAPARASAQGLWCELLLIARSRDIARAASAWHSMPGALYDFSAASENVEVKSTTGPRRIHHFTLDQTVAVGVDRVLVASFLLGAGGGGLSLGELWDEILARGELLGDARHQLDRTLTLLLGRDWRMANRIRYDPQAALNSLRLYEMKDVPRVRGDIPAEVTEVRFRSDLTDVSFEPLERFFRTTGLFGALFGDVGTR